jgi:hypothetical protein
MQTNQAKANQHVALKVDRAALKASRNNAVNFNVKVNAGKVYVQ